MSRKTSRRKDHKNRTIEVRREEGTLISQYFYSTAYQIAKDNAQKIVKEGFKNIKVKPGNAGWKAFLQKMTGFLEYSIGVFTNGQVRNYFLFLF